MSRRPVLKVVFIDPIARTVAPGYMDHQAEASTVVSQLLQIEPDFEKRGREIIKRFWRYEQPVELLLDGLRKAGLEL